MVGGSGWVGGAGGLEDKLAIHVCVQFVSGDIFYCRTQDFPTVHPLIKIFDRLYNYLVGTCLFVRSPHWPDDSLTFEGAD